MAVQKAGGIAVVASLVLAACGGGGSSSSPPTSGVTAPPVVTRSYTFPSGDASATSGATAWDIVGVTTTLSGQFGDAGGDSYDTLRVDVTFAQTIENALPLPGQSLTSGNQLGVSIALDTDANPSTGNMAACITTGSQLPFEFGSDQGNNPSRLADGNYSILSQGTPITSGGHNAPSEAMLSISGNLFSETFFLTALGVQSGVSVPKIGVAVVAVNGTLQNASGVGGTDCVPKAPSIEIFTT